MLMLIGLSLIAALIAGATTPASAAPKKPRLWALCGTPADHWLEGTTRPVRASVFTTNAKGRDKPVKGITVTIQRKISGRWVKVAKGRTNSHGNFKVKVVLKTAGPLVYRCKIDKSKKFKALRKLKTIALIDDSSTVDRRSTASLEVQGTPYSDERTTFTGRVSPVGTGRVVQVELVPQDGSAMYAGIGPDYDDIAVRPDGTFSFSRQLMGRWSVRASVLRSTDYNGYTRSNAVTVSTGSHDGLSINGAGDALPAGVVGQPYSHTFVLSDTLSGGRAGTWSLMSGTLPPGLTLNGPVLAGTPTVAGTSPFTVAFTDAQNARVRATVTLKIDPS
ncbi:hypothetical protein DX116_00900 [Aeromicrobium endophyticum]|uniref:Carboxypeptidase regulatory-like domain-containing protein n=1 Tax=Aeromicrobium endophyticum TaxID=2292704 RepID=A0A371P9S4_9ACTN|nr:hypothetical protein DX116_00900 [Aeromicrobium endophyticum]